VIINGNTLENSVGQYISMVQELTIAGASLRDPSLPERISVLGAHPVLALSRHPPGLPGKACGARPADIASPTW
jgi:hypothetical protein